MTDFDQFCGALLSGVYFQTFKKLQEPKYVSKCCKKKYPHSHLSGEIR